MAAPRQDDATAVREQVLLKALAEVRDGDFSVRLPLEWTGAERKIADYLNEIVAANESLLAELGRVSHLVGREGRLSQRLVLPESARVWSRGVEAVNDLIDDLVRPTSEMQRVIGAVAGGDLSKKITADAHGDMLELKNTINSMVDQLNRFSSEVTRVAREVGVEGKLGGQAQSAEVAGVWKDLTDNVNQLAANLTNQVRAIADVATAVTEGDLTQQVSVHASGEVAVLKDKLNEMIRNLHETTRQNTEQDWLKTNLERFTRMLQGQRDMATVSNMILSELAPLVSAQHGVFYTLAALRDGDDPALRYLAGYGSTGGAAGSGPFRLGEGLVGQCAKEKKRILLTDVPAGHMTIRTGLGESPPLNIIVLPILFEGSVRAVVELASFSPFSPVHQVFLERLTESIGVVLNTIEANTLTENLLEQSQSQAQELRSRQEELRSSNQDLERQASRLAEQNIEMERTNREIELAKRLVEEKAEQLAVSSMYKSEFFSNMSHELRTPLNSMLILARVLEDNAERNLTAEQVQYANVIRSSGTDLLRLLDDILDLAKVESGTVTLQLSELRLDDLQGTLQRDFAHVAQGKGLAFSVELSPELLPAIETDSRRLRQVLNNLLANAFKFTASGGVSVRISRAGTGWSQSGGALDAAGVVTAIAIQDSGIGILPELQRRIFEAFAQVDGTTARQYGGTGLGLSISRELVRLLGGEITLSSTPEEGSTFTVYLPTEPPVTETIRVTVAAPEEPAGRVLQSTVAAGRKVLIVDDDFRNIFALTTLLQRSDLVVLSAESGEEGVALLEQTPDVDLVLVDIMMPVMDGYATIQAMHQLPARASLPIVAVTANVAADTRRRCVDAGACAYVAKPVESADLMFVLSEWLPDLATGARETAPAR